MSDDTSILPGLSPVCGLDVHARFDGGRISSNGGALMLREAGRGLGLASQPTLSRLENTVSWRTLARMGLAMIATFCDSFERPPRQIVLDIDDTTDLVHGGQQLSLFSTPAGGSCFQPIL